jgi:hypothetical protein
MQNFAPAGVIQMNYGRGVPSHRGCQLEVVLPLSVTLCSWDGCNDAKSTGGNRLLRLAQVTLRTASSFSSVMHDQVYSWMRKGYSCLHLQSILLHSIIQLKAA